MLCNRKKSIFFVMAIFSFSAYAIDMPDKERTFIGIAQRAINESDSAKNDMQRGGIKARRDDEICASLKKRTITDWIGTVKNVNSNSDGKGILEIEVAKNIIVKTWNNAFSDSSYGTLIDPRSKIFNDASALSEGDSVKFSGTFFKGEEACIKESSMRLRGGLEEPEFIFKFTSVKKL